MLVYFLVLVWFYPWTDAKEENGEAGMNEPKPIWDFKNKQTQARAIYLYNNLIHSNGPSKAIALTTQQLTDEGWDTTPGLEYEPVTITPEERERQAATAVSYVRGSTTQVNPNPKEEKERKKKLADAEFIKPSLFGDF